MAKYMECRCQCYARHVDRNGEWRKAKKSGSFPKHWEECHTGHADDMIVAAVNTTHLTGPNSAAVITQDNLHEVGNNRTAEELLCFVGRSMP